MDKNFLVGGEELAYPGDSRGSAANVINCRCTNAPFPKELEDNYSSGGVIEGVIAVAQTVATVAAVEEILSSDNQENN
jgi:hypothetical protein